MVGTVATDLFVQVVELSHLADTVVAVKLRTVADGPLPSWSAGAHIDVVLPNGLTRQYSLIAAAEDLSWYQVAVNRDYASRGGSEYIHMFLRPGQFLTIRGPRNHFALVDASQYLFIAGGIGVTPFSSMVREARAAQRGTVVRYAGRSLSAMALRQELDTYADRVHLYPRDSGERMDIAAIVAQVAEGTEIYCCGPAGMLAEVEAAAAAAGIPQLVHVERFKPRVRKLSAPRPMKVEARRSQLTLEVPAEISLLTALERAGVAMPSGCRSGLCGACAVPVLSGQIEHRDDVLTPRQHDAGDQMLTCVSRSSSGEALVLDV